MNNDQTSTRPPLANSIVEASRRLGIGRTHTYSLIDAGELRTIRLGKRRLVPESELQRFISERIKAAEAA